MLDQELRVSLGLDALGHRLQPEAFRQVDQRPHEQLVVLALVQVLHELAVDLDAVDVEHLQVAERGVAGAEVVERQLGADLAQHAAQPHGLLDVLHRRRLGDLDGEPGGDLLVGADAAHQLADGARIDRGQARHVHRQVQVRRRAQFGQRHLHGPQVEQPHQAQLFDRRHEGARRDDAAVLRPHAQQALVLDRLPRPGIDDRLEGERQPVVAQRPQHAVAAGQGAAPERRLLGADAVDHQAVAALPLGLVERLLGAAEHVADVAGRGVHGGGADRHADRDRAGLGLHQVAPHRRQDALADQGQAAVAVAGEQHAVLVARHPPDAGVGTDAGGDALADAHDHVVDHVVAERLVQRAQVVDVHQQEAGDAALADAAGDRRPHHLGHAGPVQPPRQFVAVGKQLQPLLQRLGVGEGAQHADHPDRFAVGVAVHDGALLDPLVATVVAPDLVAAGERLALLEMARQGERAQRRVVGRDPRLVGAHVGDPGGVLDAQHGSGVLRPVQHAGLQVPVVDDVAGGGDRHPEPRQFRLVRRVLHLGSAGPSGCACPTPKTTLSDRVLTKREAGR